MNLKIIDEDLVYMAGVNLPWRQLEGKNILVSGANGALPAYMIELILHLNKTVFNRPATVFALARNETKTRARFERYQSNEHLKFIWQDVCQPVIVEDDLDYIIHAASQASPKYYGTDPVGTLLPNVLGTYNLLELARQKNIEGFLFFSSGAVYGDVSNNNKLTSEDNFGSLDPLTIESCYSESKRMGENMCTAWFKQYQIPIKIIRPFHTYGPGIALDDGRVFADFCKNIIHNEDIVMNSDGSAKRAFCYLADAVVGFFVVLLQGQVGESYNIAGDKEISILELATTLIGFFPEKNLQIHYQKNQNQGYIKTNISHYAPDTSKIRNLGWQPKYSMKNGFKRMISSYFYE